MTLFVITLGFEEKFAVRMITRRGLDEGDRLLALTGPRTEQAGRAITFLVEFAARYYGSRVAVEVEELNPALGFEELVRRVYEAVSSRAGLGERVVFNLSGGMRALCLASLLAAQLLAASGVSVEVELETEDSSALLSVPRPLLNLPSAALELTAEKLKILGALAEGPATARELAEKLGRDFTTVSKHLRALEKLELLRAEGGRPKRYSANSLAQLISSALSTRGPGGE